ncbi:hypothetical protein SARC_07230 [Sphaeroforma arctica JP610]|uniref:Calcium-transporting ATPase n=1 Tax=Sphaeroforma arctica JP610 TaxID=667725 RepID=A0A0L0FV21_9EUKA|nr:hypothetical protein SARC_07230 [Sphaeroforma arctica JP610]KNC80411.1 hypothetical protein SARC_07230 [Sphaeroforma arctica JP610]|eukprot:XP_014154313.1 hypothetical protein SARC_07230 [Sphaeroforma arctica JP610]
MVSTVCSDVNAGDLVALLGARDVKATLDSSFGGVDGLVKALHADTENGLSAEDDEDIKGRADDFGDNRVPSPPQRSLLLLMWDALHDVTLVILLVAGVISLIIGLTVEEDKSIAWIEGASILGVVAIVVLVDSINNYQKEKQFRELNNVKEDEKVNVLRSGNVCQISKFDVVVGDIICLEQGAEVVADGIIIDAHSLLINESSLTGEADDVAKIPDSASMLVLSSTLVMDGVGRMLVLAVGENSQAGIIKMLCTGMKRTHVLPATSIGDDAAPPVLTEKGEALKDKVLGSETVAQVATIDVDGYQSNDVLQNVPGSDNKNSKLVAKASGTVDNGDEYEKEEVVVSQDGQTALETKLERLAILIGYVGLAVGTLTFVVLSVRFCIEEYPNRGWEKDDFSEFLDFFIIGITVLVVAIPEGLPLAVTLALAFSMKRMLKENNLVRHLHACETMGSATVICSDKTGTLTTNSMTVVKANICQTELKQKESCQSKGISAEATQILLKGIAVNTTAEVQAPESGVGPTEYVGNKTECALLDLVCAHEGSDYREERSKAEVLRLCPFSSERKCMSVAIQLEGEPDTSRVYCKGASEIVYGRCTKQLTKDGCVVDITAADRAMMDKMITTWASEALRTLCLSYKDVSASLAADPETTPVQLETDLICIGIVGIEDPIRPEVPDAIAICKRAGVDVKMVTGDNVSTARAIAKQCGILTDSPDELVMEGRDFRSQILNANGSIKQDVFDTLWPRVKVLARSSPEDKYNMVRGLKATEVVPQVVAVTGDGTNDAPALRQADIGFAMGIQGTSVAKSASDIIILDDNFNSIISALKWGRNVYDSISKFVQFQLTVNVVALVVAFTGACIVQESPLSAVQLLWVNLIMDTLASLALATEPPTDALLLQKPHSRTKALISRGMWQFIFGHSLYQLVVTFFVLFAGPSVFGYAKGETFDGEPNEHYTMVFNVFVWCQLFNEVNARKLHGSIRVLDGILNNKVYIVVMIVQCILQVLIVTYGGRAFGVVALPIELWGYCMLLGFGEMPWNVVVRKCPKLLPESWRTHLKKPLPRPFFLKSKSKSGGAKDFREEQDDAEGDIRLISTSPNKMDELFPQNRHMSMYESALLVILSNTKQPKVRLQTAICLVQERRRAMSENSVPSDDDGLTPTTV